MNDMHTDDQPIVDEDFEATEPSEAEEAPEAEEGAEPTPAESGPRLILKRNNAETDVVFAVASPSIVGRFDPSVGPIDVDLGTIPEGSYVSRKHAKLWEEDGVWKVQDLGSSNGTFILRDDFEKIDEAELSDGSEVAFGNARFIFKLS